MQQYWDVKAAHPDKLILFRMGDFFEMFYRDAEVGLDRCVFCAG